MTQVTELINHVDKQVTPWVSKLQALDKEVNGNGTTGLKTKVAVMEQDITSFKVIVNERLDKIELKIDRSQWFTIVTLVGVVISIVLRVV